MRAENGALIKPMIKVGITSQPTEAIALVPATRGRFSSPSVRRSEI
jgi:hypothetical protein